MPDQQSGSEQEVVPKSIYVLRTPDNRPVNVAGFGSRKEAKAARDRLAAKGIVTVVSRGLDHPQGPSFPAELVSLPRARLAQPELIMAEPPTAQQLTAAIVADMAGLQGLLKRVERVPVLWRFNGCGTTLLGHLRPSRHSPAFFTRLFVTVLWVPIVPLGVYLVTHSLDTRGQPHPSSYDFLAQIDAKDFHRAYQANMCRFYLQAFCNALVTIVVIVAAVALAAWLATLFGAHNVLLRFRL